MSLFLFVALGCSLAVVAQSGGPVHRPGGSGGLSLTAADGRYLKLDASNDPVTGDLALDEDLTIGNASGDAVTVNSATWTFANDTNMSLTGGVNGLSIDGTTLSIDSANRRVGIGTDAPLVPLHVNATSGITLVVTADSTGSFSGPQFEVNSTTNYNPTFITWASAWSVLAEAKALRGDGSSGQGGQLVFSHRRDPDNTGMGESFRIAQAHTTFNGSNLDLDFVVDSATEEAAFSVDGQTTANLALAADGDIDASAVGFNLTTTGNVVAVVAGNTQTLTTGSTNITSTGAITLDSTASITLNAGSVNADTIINADTVAAITIDGASTSSLVCGIAAGNSDGDCEWTFGDDFAMSLNTTNGVVTTEAASWTFSGATSAMQVTMGSNAMASPKLTTGTPMYWKLPGIVNTNPTKPACGESNEGAMLYVDDTDDAQNGMPCFCMTTAADRSVFGWVNLGGGACAGS